MTLSGGSLRSACGVGGGVNWNLRAPDGAYCVGLPGVL